MHIRPAVFADIPAIAALVKSLAHFYLDNPAGNLPVWLTDTLTDEAFMQRFANPDFLQYVCEYNGQLVGYVALKQPGHLYHLFVAGEFQGLGIARLLWERVIMECSSSVFTLRSSIYAVPVYRRFGFVETGPGGYKDGVSFQPMELTLAQ